jgi:hypothetical protein
MSQNCPICNKAGLPDYTKSNVVCSQCNSDLKAFFLLHSICKPQKNKIGTYTIIGFLLFSGIFFGLFLKSNSGNKELITKIVILNDSITQIQSMGVITNGEKEPKSVAEKQDAIVKYVVKKGDYLCKIATFFYNDGSKYKQIAADNNLEHPYTLKIGQILTIKIPQE